MEKPGMQTEFFFFKSCHVQVAQRRKKIEMHIGKKCIQQRSAREKTKKCKRDTQMSEGGDSKCVEIWSGIGREGGHQKGRPCESLTTRTKNYTMTVIAMSWFLRRLTFFNLFYSSVQTFYFPRQFNVPKTDQQPCCIPHTRVYIKNTCWYNQGNFTASEFCSFAF